MYRIAIKMLVGDRAKFFGILFGLTFASLLITQQAAIFTGLMTRTYAYLKDTAVADIWVMDPGVEYVDQVKPMRDTVLYRVRGIEGVRWAAPLYRNRLQAKLPDGTFESIFLIGIDDANLVGGPPEMADGRLLDLRRPDSVIIDMRSAKSKLAHRGADAEGPERPMQVGDVFEINDHRAIVVGRCVIGRTFQDTPHVYTTYNRALSIAPPVRKNLSFVLVKAESGQDLEALCERIEKATRLKALTRVEFQWDTFWYWMRETGIPINFGIAVVLGFIVGTAIAGQTFYNFTLDNLRYFGALKAMGARNGLLLRMILLQALVAGSLGYGFGVGLAALIGFQARGELAFKLPWQLLVASAVAVLLICLASAAISSRRVLKLDPAIVFQD